MFKEVSKKTKTIVMIIAVVTLLVITGITYAFFSASAVSGNSATNNIVVQTAEHGDVIVRYDGGKNTISSNNMILVEGGEHLYDYIKYSVEYTGNVPQDTYMYFKDVTNTFCQYANGQICTNDVDDTYVGDEYSYTTYYCDNVTKYNNIESATDTDLSSCTIINTEHTSMPLTGENKYLSTTNPTTFNNASTKYYVVVARLENKDTEQNYNQNKSFTGKVYIDINPIGHEVSFGETTLTFDSADSLAYKMLSDEEVTKSTAIPTLEKAAVNEPLPSSIGEYQIAVCNANSVYYNIPFCNNYCNSSSEYYNINACTEKFNKINNVYVVENGIYQTQDDDGISYFYRGHVERNYVKFAGFIWRIVRINGDGSIRIVLDGLTSTVKKDDPANTLCTSGCAGSNTTYNTSSDWDTGTGPSNAVAEETTALEYASYDNGNLEGAMYDFYEAYIYDEANSIDYREYLIDSTFCSDASWGDVSGSSWLFAPYRRLESGTSSLQCGTNYRYKTANGTGKLTYPIATLSIDEINYAGGKNLFDFGNKNYYLYNSITVNDTWWTMTPYGWNLNGSVDAYHISSDGNLDDNYVYYTRGVRPVVNLKDDTLTTTGIGTSGDPYQVG